MQDATRGHELAAKKAAIAAADRSPIAQAQTELAPKVSLAKLNETVTRWSLAVAERALASIRRRFEAAASETSAEAYRTAGTLRLRIEGAERDVSQWHQKLAAAELERLRLEHSLAAWTRTR